MNERTARPEGSQPQRRRKRPVAGRLVRRAALAVLAVVVVVAALASFLVFTAPGRTVLIRVVEAVTRMTGSPVTIAAIEGPLDDLRLRDIGVGDRDGPWLSIDSIALGWRPAALLRRAVVVERLDVGRVDVTRMPHAEPSSQPSEGFALPVDVSVAGFKVGTVSLASSVAAGRAVDFGLSGRLDLPVLTEGAPVDIDVSVDGQGPDDPDARLALTFRSSDQTLGVSIDASEPAGGVVHRMARLGQDAPLALVVKGEGPLDSWAGTLRLALGDQTLTEGKASIARVNGGRRITADLDATIAETLPGAYQPLAEGGIRAVLSTLVGDDGVVEIEKADLAAAAGTMSATGRVATATGELDLAVEAGVAKSDVFGGLTGAVATWDRATLSAKIGGTSAAPSVTLTGQIEKPAAGPLTGSALTLQASSSEVTSLLGASGSRQIDLVANLQDAALAGRKLDAAGAPRLNVKATVDDSGKAAIDDAELVALGLTVKATGGWANGAATIDLAAETKDLKPIGTLVDHPLGGGAKLALKGSGDPERLTGNADVQLAAEGLATGIPALDALLGAAPKLTAGLSAANDTVTVERFSLEGAKLTASAKGGFGTSTQGLTLDAALADLSALAPTLAGQAKLAASLTGSFEAPVLKAKISSAEIVAAGQRIRDLKADLEGSRHDDGRIDGRLTLAGSSSGRPVTGSVAFAHGPDGQSLKVADLAFVGLTASGDLSLSAAGKPGGRLVVRATDVAPLAALAGQQASGGFDATIDLGSGGADEARLDLKSARLAVADATVTDLSASVVVAQPLGTPRFNATVTAASLVASGANAEAVRVTAAGPLTAIVTEVGLRLQGAAIASRATVSLPDGQPLGSAVDVALASFSANRDDMSVALSRPGRVSYRPDRTSLDLALAVRGGGTATVTGNVGTRALDLSVDVAALPLALSRIFVPELGLSGTLATRARITGTPAAPRIAYNLNVRGARVAAMPDAAPSIDLDLQGTTGTSGVTLNGAVNAGSTRITLDGTAPTTASGRFSIRMRGDADLALVNQIVPSASRQVGGRLSLDGTAQGTLAEPDFNGTLRVAGVSFSDVMTGVDFRDISGVIRLDRRVARLENITGRAVAGGTLAITGTVGLDPATGFPADIAIAGRSLVLRYQGMVRAQATADITIRGPAASAPEIAGNIVLGQVDVTIPDRLPSSAAPIDVIHINVPPDQIDLFTQPAPPRPAGSAEPKPFDPKMDITVTANNRVFVRGQGIDAEFAGRFAITGTASAPIVNGDLDMRRGTLTILGRNLTFSRGNLTFVDSLDPLLDLIAETRASDITAQIVVTGRASAPVFNFTSSPPLPQDEVLARLLFGKSAGNLSAGEALALADAVGNLSGFSRGPGLLDRIRRMIGLSQLNMTSDAHSNPALQAGGYATDNLYIGVRQGTSAASTRVTVDLDITKHLRLQGEVGITGEAKIGIGTEMDY